MSRKAHGGAGPTAEGIGPRPPKKEINEIRARVNDIERHLGINRKIAA